MFRSVSVLFAFCTIAAAVSSCSDGGIGPCLEGMCQAGATCLTASSMCCENRNLIGGITTGPPCADKLNPETGISDCSKMAAYCNDHFYYDVMTEQCPKTCNRCNMVGTTLSPKTCVDRINLSTGRSDCPAMSSYCTNSVYRNLMREQCPKTCGFC